MRGLLSKIRADFTAARNGKGVLALLTAAQSEPRQLGAAVAVGVAIGMTPFFGLHLIICVGAAVLLRLNALLVYAAAHVSIPPLIPFIALACVQTGHFVLHGRFLPLTSESAAELRGSFFVDWVVGALVCGAAIGIPLGLGVATLAGRCRRRPERVAGLAAATFDLYRAALPDGRMQAEILRGKLRHDVAYGDVLRRISGARSLLDVGGGAGALALLARAMLPELLDATVVDWDETKLEQGRRIGTRLGKSVRFDRQDVFAPTARFAPAEAIVCLDVLHYADLASQRQLVGRLAAALPPGGRLLIRDMNADLALRTRCTVLQERMSLALRRTRASRIVPRSGGDLEAQLRAAGLAVTAEPCHGWTPFSNTLWVAVRPG
jgi:uncharacterized protein (DUF2062 family)/2-polyprenyl-3-methyl-5-hydroxy-6-metoxy-1,4-benzoquinol methylase